MNKADVVVVGAGPSGAAASYFLAKNGVDVIVVDKSTFPREKTCGDGVGPRALEMLDKMGLYSWVSSGAYYRCDRVRMFSNIETFFEAAIPAEDTTYPHIFVVSRKDFDQAVIDVAVKAGAKLITNCKATSIVFDKGQVETLRVVRDGQREDIKCKAVICADGTNGSFTKHAGIDVIAPQAMAVRAYFENVKGLDDCLNVMFDPRISEGYSWVFPTSKTTANIGLGISLPSLKSHPMNAKQLLNWFVQEKNHMASIDLSEATMTSDIKGAYLRMGYGNHTVAGDGIMLVGDAAAMISPVSGEGIAYALETGEIAAQVLKDGLDRGDVSAAALRPYQDHLKKQYFPAHRHGFWMRSVLSQSSYKLLDRTVKQARKHPELAAKFISVMLTTADPQILLHPNMLRYLI